MKKFDSMPAETSTVPFLTVLTGGTRGPYWPCPSPGTRSPVSAQSCSSDASTHSPASQPWYVPALALMCLGAPAAGEGKKLIGPSSSFGADGLCSTMPKPSCSLSPSAARQPPEPPVLLLPHCCRTELLHTGFVLLGFGK